MPTEMNTKKEDCPQARTLSTAIIQASIVISNSSQSEIVSKSDSCQGHIDSVVHSPIPSVSSEKTTARDCSDNSLGFTPIKHQSTNLPILKNAESTKKHDPITSQVATHMSKPQYDHCTKMLKDESEFNNKHPVLSIQTTDATQHFGFCPKKNESDPTDNHPVLSLQTAEDSQPPFGFCMKTPSKTKNGNDSQIGRVLLNPDNSQPAFDFCLKTPVKNLAQDSHDKNIGKSPRRKRFVVHCYLID